MHLGLVEHGSDAHLAREPPRLARTLPSSSLGEGAVLPRGTMTTLVQACARPWTDLRLACSVVRASGSGAAATVAP